MHSAMRALSQGFGPAYEQRPRSKKSNGLPPVARPAEFAKLQAWLNEFEAGRFDTATDVRDAVNGSLDLLCRGCARGFAKERVREL